MILPRSSGGIYMKEHGVMDFTPVLIGGGQAMLRARVEGDKVLGPSPLDLMQQSVAAAWKDAGIEAANDQVDALGLTRLAMDTIANGEDRNSQYANFPGALAEKIGASADAKLLLTEGGGSSPQKLINILAERIARGELSCAVAAGAEALDTQTKRYRQGVSPQWEDAECGSQRPAWENTGSPRASGTDHERKHKLVAPVNCYPLYAHGLAARDGQNSAEHRRQCAELFAGFSKVAASNPFSWFPQERSAQEIAEVTEANRMIGLPYTKYLNAVMQVNQGAAVLICSYRKAMELGVSKDKVVFLHGCAEASEIWNQTERVDFISSPAIRSAASKALEIADIGPGKLRYLDIYSCFPCAVQIACAEIGLEPRTGDQLTLTGGLPYFGGAGNNYALHGVVEMLKRLRADPGSYGLVNANGWYLTKHAVGIYSHHGPAT